MTLRLGIIGFSEGNGHPYSWSAIFNGYDATAMDQCGFPVICEYLAKQKWPEASISGAKVTCVWTQDAEISRKIAAASLIEDVVNNPREMIGRVDGILLARDDANSHYDLAVPFLDAGLPVYIDKPICLSLMELNSIYNHERYPGQVFSCSALRYAEELRLESSDYEKLGEIRQIYGFTPKNWDTYAVHVLDPILKMIKNEDSINMMHRYKTGDTGVQLSAVWESGLVTMFNASGNEVSSPLTIRVLGVAGWEDFVFKDSFSCFRSALEDFVDGIKTRAIKSPRAFNEKVVAILEAGRRE